MTNLSQNDKVPVSGVKQRVRFFNLCLLFLSFVTVVHSPLEAQRGAAVVPRGLDVLIDRAQTIVRGHVVSARVEPHPQFSNLETLVVELSVDEVLKGNPDKTMTMRQYIWDVRDRYDKAGYSKGQELLLLVNPTSEYGLTSIAGMEQGRFRISRQPNGKAIAVNGTQNAGLFGSVAQNALRRGVKLSARSIAFVAKSRSGPVSLDDLEGFIRDWNAATARAK